MNIEVGLIEAQTRLPELLRAVERGERYTITLRGRRVADLVPSQEAAVEAMRNITKVKGLSEKTVTRWIAEGRR